MIAALKHGRKCIGIEILKERIRYTKIRVLKELGIEEQQLEKPLDIAKIPRQYGPI
jgi:DNA modification methylase